MKMAILELEYKNIRKITALKLPFTKADGSVISNNFIMMANGTGKTTTMELIKGLFDGTAAGWTASKVRSFAPTLTEADTGEFSITVKFDDRQYKYFLSMNYKDGTVQVETSAPPKGREAGLRLPESIRGIFTPEFVRRFVFDGEQAAKSMDSSSMKLMKRFATYIASMNWMRFWPQTRESLPKSKTPKESVEHPVHLAICVPGKVTLTQFGPS